MLVLRSWNKRSASSSLAMLASFAVAFTLAILTPLASALSATGQRVLVILPSKSQQSTYSSFLSDLTDRGFQLTYREEKTGGSEVALTAFDERQYDHLVFFPSSASSTPLADLTPQALVSFVRKGGNIIFGYGPDRPDWLQDLAREFSVELAGKGQRLVDHFQYSTAEGDHTTVVLGGSEGDAGGLVPNNVIFSAATLQAASSQPLLVGSASPHRLGPNPLAFPLVGTSATSYTAAKEDEGEVGFLGTDEDAAIASAFQTKENTRVAFVGSTELFSDSLLGAKDVKSSSGGSYSSTLNAAFLRDVTSWIFQEHGVLKVEKRSHFRARESATDIREPYEEPAEGGSAIMYRISDTVRYSLDISQHTPRGWEPAPADLDLQVSLIMIDPFITSWLSPELPSSPASDPSSFDLSPPLSNATTRYSTSFKLPDRLGVYTFQTHWSRPGWTFIKTRDVAPIRAFNHDENPRFLPASWPYALGSFSTIASFLLFVALWVFTGEKSSAGVKKEKTL